jgi:hypothetical protein
MGFEPSNARLRLHAETVRRLTDADLGGAAGATGPCPTETCPPLTFGCTQVGVCYTNLQLNCLLATGNPCK